MNSPVRVGLAPCQLMRDLREVLESGRALGQVPLEPPQSCSLELRRSALRIEVDELEGVLERKVRELASLDDSADLLDHLDELVDGISLPASELHQLPNLLHDSAALGRPGHGRTTTASKFEQCMAGRHDRCRTTSSALRAGDSRQ